MSGVQCTKNFAPAFSVAPKMNQDKSVSLALDQTDAHRASYSLLTQFWEVGNSVLLSQSLCSEHSSHGHNRSGMPWIAKHQWIKHSHLTDTIFTAILRHSWQWDTDCVWPASTPCIHKAEKLSRNVWIMQKQTNTPHLSKSGFPSWLVTENLLGILSPL